MSSLTSIDAESEGGDLFYSKGSQDYTPQKMVAIGSAVFAVPGNR